MSVTILGFLAPPAWTEDALCAQTDSGDLFFPGKGDSGGRIATARQVCALCPAREACLEYALAYESGAMGVEHTRPEGIWGGLTPNQRKAILADRAAAQQEAS